MKILLLVLFSLTQVQAASEESYQIAGKTYYFKLRNGVLVSGCEKNAKRSRN